MSYSYTASESQTFTITHARHMSAKVATDLKRLQRLYPSAGLTDLTIAEFEEEAALLLKAGFLGEVIYGFKRDGNWIAPTVRYTARDLIGCSAADDDPGRIPPGKNVDGATFHSFLTYSAAWEQATPAQREQFQRSLPFRRGIAAAPGVNGYFVDDLTYSAGGRAIGRSSLRGF